MRVNILVQLPEPAAERETDRLLGIFFPESRRVYRANASVLEGMSADLAITVAVESKASEWARTLSHEGAQILAPGVGSSLALATATLCGAGRTVVRQKEFSVAEKLDPDLFSTERSERSAGKRAERRAARRALYEALCDWTGTEQPWGVLTGVRPVKLVHEWWRMHPDSLSARRDEEASRHLESDYRVAPDRARLATEVARRELGVTPDLYTLLGEVSVYVGVPFCPTHCAYCTFPAYSMVEKARYADGFLKAITKEIESVGRVLREYGVPVTTVYVGGGTPTSLKAPELRELLESLLRHLPGGGAWREFNVEAGRADTITADRVAVMRELGVSRVSVNPQSFKAQTLKTIGRGHSPDIVAKRFWLLRDAGFSNINMDLILGLPGETAADVEDSLERTLALSPDAVTVHTLSFKRTAAVNREREAYAIPRDSVVREMMAVADRKVRAAGHQPYYLYRQKDILANLENVGFAMPGKEGIYNILIMEEAQSIIGLGGGAASKWVDPWTRAIAQDHNPSEPKAYTESIDRLLEKKEVRLRALGEAIAVARDRSSAELNRTL